MRAFIVSPGLRAAVVARCHELGVPVLPGVATATEIMAALDAGSTPSSSSRPSRSAGSAHAEGAGRPFPDVRFVPTGGIDAANLADYLAVPRSLAVGGSWMVAAATCSPPATGTIDRSPAAHAVRRSRSAA